VSAARARANRKLYHAAVLQRMLQHELAREEVPARVVLDAVGESVRLALLDAYGWFLLELAGVDELPSQPPHRIIDLLQAWPQAEPLRGELVELQNLERAAGWLAELQASPPVAPVAVSQPPGALSTVELDWSAERLEQWHSGLSELMDRMSDSLDEW